jgi:microcystin-dependent protein
MTSTSATDLSLEIYTKAAMASGDGIVISNVIVGPGTLVQGVPVDGWQSFITTGSWTTNTTYTGKKRHVGGEIEYQIYIQVSGGDPNNATTLTVNLPTGDVIDTSKLAGGTDSRQILGYANLRDQSASQETIEGSVRYYSTTSVYVTSFTRTSDTIIKGTPVTDAAPFEWTNADYILMRFTVPIVGLSSGVYLANGASSSPAKAGFIQAYAGSTAPSGWAACDGSAVSRTTYADLFANIGTTWGSGDGSTTFNLPDLRAAAAAGAGTSTGYTTNETLTLGTKYNDQFQGHQHANHSASALDPASGTMGWMTGTNNGGTQSAANSSVQTLGTNGTPRYGAVTRGKLVAVTYIIKLYNDNPASVVGFSGASVGTPGLVNNDAANTAGTPIKGRTDGGAASAGYVGEVKSTYTFDATPLTTDTARTIMTMTLPAGTWQVFGKASAFVSSGGGISYFIASFSTTANTINNQTSIQENTTTVNFFHVAQPVPLIVRTNGSTGQYVYMVVQSGLSGTVTPSATYSHMYAVRIQD